MTRLGPMLLVGLSVLLAAALATLWLDPQTLQMRNMQWQPPAAREPDFAAMAPLLASHASPEAAEFVTTLNRPLFSPSRRPPVPLPPPALAKPPPVEVVAEKPPPDPLADVKILGMYTGANSGGIIATVDGKARRAHLNDKIADWTITSIGERDVTFSQAGATRVLPLEVKRPASGAAAAQRPTAPPRDAKVPPGPAAAALAPVQPADSFVFAGQPPSKPAAAPAEQPRVRP